MRLRSLSIDSIGVRLTLILGLWGLIIVVYVLNSKSCRRQRDKIFQKLLFTGNLHKAGVPLPKANDIVNEKFLKEEQFNKHPNDAIKTSEIANILYQILFSTESMDHFHDFFLLLSPEHMEFIIKEIFLFRYFMIVFFSKFFIPNDIYKILIDKLNNLITQCSNIENRIDSGGSEFLSLALSREIQYRLFLPIGCDYSGRESVTKFIKNVAEHIIFSEDSNLRESLMEEYFITREKIRIAMS
jgi:hypothetical protein